ncbi:MAG: M1 family peptidase [Cyclobacteriaceae bacterium]|nr:M1 family peptidase [Cyclobacteriaceae bacterium]
MKQWLFALILFPFSVWAVDPYPRQPQLDVQHYVFRLALYDSTDVVTGHASVTIRFVEPVTSFELDLVGKERGGKGMGVTSVQLNGKSLASTFRGDRLVIQLPEATRQGERKTFEIRYQGIPADGLIIGRNKFGDRTFFGDNWPNRAHHWLPTIDHPSDKATVEFLVTAPEQYSVVANGLRTEEYALPGRMRLTHWSESVPLPTKVMVIGAARFAIREEGKVEGIPVQTWVYPQNKDAGFTDYAIGVQVLDYFQHHLAQYPFEKLANVQSTTRYGGMENAGNIFYFENSVNGLNQRETLFAHEIAHQWFGDSASEGDWYHVWLSEGFATYLTHLYLEHTYGRDRMAEELQDDRRQVVAYFRKNPTPIIQSGETDLTKLLNTNSYQKASWVLHMLRREVGDENFWKGIRAYYRKYQLSNALTDDFRAIMEDVSGQSLEKFFRQWLWQPGHPQLAIQWHYDATKKTVEVDVLQKDKVFEFPLEIGVFEAPESVPVVQKLLISGQNQHFSFPSPRPVRVVADPGTWLLFEGSCTETAK